MKRVSAFALLVLASAGCRGNTFTQPPFHLIGDMDWQPKYHPQGESTFFKDQRSMRPLVEGTIARGSLHDDDPLYTGMEPGTNTFVRRGPRAVTKEVLARGQERFNIYCSPCHDKTGSGKGLVVTRGGFYPPIDLAGDRVRGLPDGEIFNAISKGVRNMPSYGFQVPAEDRWAIVAWVRVLGRSQHASIGDVPDNQKSSIEPEGGSK